MHERFLRAVGRWKAWFFKFKEERPNQSDDKKDISWSPLLYCIGLLFFTFRRFSLFENIKHLISEPFSACRENRTPALFVDLWIVFTAFLVILLLFIFPILPFKFGCLFFSISLFCAVQIVQTNLFHLIWRTTHVIKAATKPHNEVRNVFILFIGQIQTILFFGIAYYNMGTCVGFDAINFSKPISSIWDGLYLSFAIGMTLELGQNVPKSVVCQVVVILQIFLSVTMFSLLISRAVALVPASYRKSSLCEPRVNKRTHPRGKQK